jgi:hypothetical protein
LLPPPFFRGKWADIKFPPLGGLNITCGRSAQDFLRVFERMRAYACPLPFEVCTFILKKYVSVLERIVDKSLESNSGKKEEMKEVDLQN